jgi:hypothetical protein
MAKLKARIIEITSNDDKVKFEELLIAEFKKLNGFDQEHEDWLDSEFNKVFVTYMYPDVTKMC